MGCFAPLAAWRSRHLNENGKRPLVFDLSEAYKDLQVEVPCGVCLGCKLQKAKEWELRAEHEMSLHDRNCFLTLTYEDRQLPPGGSLRRRDFDLFMKRLRKAYGSGIRFLACGEYGEKFARPHFHVLLFGWSPDDLRLHSYSGQHPIYRSASVERLWTYGFSSVGSATPASAGYVARYVLKKVVGPAAGAHYAGREPEFQSMSRHPGIGRGYVDRFPTDFLQVEPKTKDGRRVLVPRYYRKVLDDTHPTEARIAKARRKASRPAVNLTQRSARITIITQRAAQLRRTYEAT